MKRVVGLIMIVTLALSVLVTPVMASESMDDLENEKMEASNEESEPVITVGAETETGEEQSSGGILKFVILFALMIGISLLRPFLMQRSLRKNYYDERVWGLDKHRKF